MTETIDVFLSDVQADIWEDMSYNPGIHEMLIGGSAGGGKSLLLCMWQIWRRCTYPNTRGLIGRYSFTTLQDTTLKTFQHAWVTYGRHNPMGVSMNMIGKTAYFSNGSEIIFRWLKDSGSTDENFGLGSLELTDAAVDEVTEVPEAVINMLNTRIRHRLIDGSPKLVMSCNPAINWVKWKWIKTKKGTPVVLEPYQKYCPLGLADNPDRVFARQYRSQLEKLDGADKARLLYGDWDEVDNEKPWFFSFDKNIHLSNSPFIPDEFEPIYLSFDFNMEPMTCTAGQYIPEKGLVVFRCHELEGTTTMMCDELLKYEYYSHIGGLLITGDVSGKARHTSAGVTKYGDISTDYSIIKEKFDLTDMQIIHTGKQNPRLKYSRRLINHIFTKQVITIIESGCPELIEDIKSAIAKPDDTIYKTLDNGMHHADNFRYLCHMVFKKGFQGVNDAAKILNFTEANQVQSSFAPSPTQGVKQSTTPLIPNFRTGRKRR